MTEIHAIHGFLGLPTDWNLFNFSKLHAYNLTNPSIAPAADGFWGWAKRFNQEVQPKEGFMLGYSLGGRLGLHALLDRPNHWKGAIIVSSHTGFKTEKERMTRLQVDAEWADLFEKEPWEKVLQMWNIQSVFGGVDYPLMRQEKLFSRKHLADQLRFGSRGHQDDLSKPVQNLQMPLLWICGELDPTFHQVAKELSFAHPLSRIEIVHGAAHRVPWEQPHKFIKIVHSFINEVISCL